MTPRESRSWEFFIPLYRDLPSDTEEPSASHASPIAASVDIRQELFTQQSVGGCVICPGCLRSFDQTYLDLMDVDHIVPSTRGGTNTWDNVQLLCRTCNASKKQKPLTRFLQRRTTRDWEEAIRSIASEQPDDHIDGHWAYFLDIAFHLNAVDTDFDKYPAVSLFDLSELIGDALQGVIWKRRSQVVRASSRKAFSDDINHQGVRISVRRIFNGIQVAPGDCKSEKPA